MKYLSYILIIACIGSCSTPKMVNEKRQSYQLDSLVEKRKDSVVIRQSFRSALQSEIRLTHYRLSPPDSTGKQYVETVTRGEVLQTHDQSGIVQENRNSIQSTELVSREDVGEDISVRQTAPARKWVIYGVLSLGLVLIVLYRLRSLFP